jgi:hypothetical protein
MYFTLLHVQVKHASTQTALHCENCTRLSNKVRILKNRDISSKKHVKETKYKIEKLRNGMYIYTFYNTISYYFNIWVILPGGAKI